MGLGERVRISRPPPGKEHLENLKATVVTLVPIAKHPFDYTVRLDKDDAEHTLPADSLEPLTYLEEADGPDELFGGVTVVNNLMYCLSHRLEICGACGMDHRSTNYMQEMPTGDVDASLRLCDEMRLIGAPSRQAPRKKAKKQATTKAIFRPAVNAHLLTIPEGFDPSSCQPFPRGLPAPDKPVNSIWSHRAGRSRICQTSRSSSARKYGDCFSTLGPIPF